MERADPRGEEIRPHDPEIDEDVEPAMLDRMARKRLRTLTKENSDRVAKHLVMAGRLVDTEPELAYEHAQSALRRAARVDIVREAVAVTAYATERWAEALRELRTVRRLSGVDVHRAMEADCERGLGRPERALAVIAEAPEPATQEERVELAIVASGARADLGEHEAALSVLERVEQRTTDPALLERLALVRADRLETLGRSEEAAAIRDAVGATGEEPEMDIVVTDLLPDGEDARPDERRGAAVGASDAVNSENPSTAAQGRKAGEPAGETGEPANGKAEAPKAEEPAEAPKADEPAEALKAEGPADEAAEAQGPVVEGPQADEADTAR